MDESNIQPIYSEERPPASATVKGVRFELSKLGIVRNPRFAKRNGTVIGNSRVNNSVRVLFDGRKTPMSLHRDYIKLIPSKPE
jgi:hypothetical protein